MNVLVTGGAGYIGSHTVKRLSESGYGVTVFDNLVYGHQQSIGNVPLVVGDLLNFSQVSKVFSDKIFDAVIHFAAYASVGESARDPYKYFNNNVLGTLNLLEAMVKAGVKNLVFSSTCAIFGTPSKVPIGEDADKNPESPYGESKLMVERILSWYQKIFDLRYVSLRYFNAAGASLDGSIGEDVRPPIRIIPNLMEVVLGKKDSFTLNGNDYSTEDGTCIRDYVHVLDLAQAHLLALKYFKEKKGSEAFNLGAGLGTSNLQVIDLVKKVTGVEFKVLIGPRRIGDPVALYADNAKAGEILGWRPQYSDLETIVKSSWLWHKRNPYGYP